MLNELYIFSGGRGNTQRQAHYTFTDVLKAAEFAQKVNGKLVPMLHYCDGHWLTIYNVWFDYIEAEYEQNE